MNHYYRTIMESNKRLNRKEMIEKRTKSRNIPFQDNSWWIQSDSSSDSSEFSDNNSYIPEWEDKINSRGELFYVVRRKQVSSANVNRINQLNDNSNDSPSGLLVRLIRRKSSRKSFNRINHGNRKDNSKDDLYNVTVRIDPDNVPNLGRRAKLSELFLGLTTNVQRNQVVVNGFIPSSTHIFENLVQIGDAIHKIDGNSVNSNNLDDFLLKYIKTASDVTLTFKRNKHNKRPLIDFSNSSLNESANSASVIGLLYTKLNELTEGGSPEQGVAYKYPKQNNPLIAMSGICYTLQNLIPNISSTHPVSTTLNINGSPVHVLYTAEEKDLLLLALPSVRYTLKESFRINENLLKCLRFTYQTLSRCFTTDSNKSELDHFFKEFFSNLNSELMNNEISRNRQFETIMPVSQYLPLPRELQIQLGDALNELEANDVKFYENERLYSIVGTCFYHKGLLLANQINKDDLIDITTFCRHYNLLKLSEEGVEDVVVWKEVFISSCCRGLSQIRQQPYSIPNGKWFLMIVAQDHDLLAVLLESGGCAMRTEDVLKPDMHYVEEAQATLYHIQSLGIAKVVKKWFEESQKIQKSRENLLNKNKYLETSFNSTHFDSSFSKSTLGLSNIKSSDSVPSFRHRYSLDQQTIAELSNFNYVKSNSLPNVNGPILGRRFEREQAINHLNRTSESDISDESDLSKDKKSDDMSLFEMSELSRNLLDISYLPLNCKNNSNGNLFHYVYLDSNEGVLISNLIPNLEFNNIINNFRLHAHTVHNILNNTISFKKLKSQDVNSTVINRSLIAVKEHGILFESCGYEDAKKCTSFTYWVIGRIFFTPHLKEVYICHQDTCPQNLIEIAFKLGLSASM